MPSVGVRHVCTVHVVDQSILRLEARAQGLADVQMLPLAVGGGVPVVRGSLALRMGGSVRGFNGAQPHAAREGGEEWRGEKRLWEVGGRGGIKVGKGGKRRGKTCRRGL